MIPRHAILVLLIGTAAAPALADTALGRLFFTPAERAALDRAPADGEPMAQRTPRTLNGVVRRSDGQGTVWIDGKPQPRQLNSAQSITVETPDGDARRLKVGESTDMRAADTPLIRIEPHR
jgi:hypothetical protein